MYRFGCIHRTLYETGLLYQQTAGEGEDCGRSHSRPTSPSLLVRVTAMEDLLRSLLRPTIALRFSQQLSADHLVLELREDEDRFDDVADRGRAEADVLDRAPPL